MANIRKLPKFFSKRKMLADILLVHDNKQTVLPTSQCKQMKFIPRNRESDRILFINGRGQLKISVYVNCGHLTVEVSEGRRFNSKWKTVCNSYVKVSLVPNDGCRSRCKTNVIPETNHPVFSAKFSFELSDSDYNKRLFISAWHKDEEQRCSEFLGCMSFGIKNILSSPKTISGWYYLLAEDVGRKKHLKVTTFRPRLRLTGSGDKNVSETMFAAKPNEPELMTLVIKRGRSGFGFSVHRAGSLKVKHVEEGSQAERAGLQIADNIVRLNGHNVTKSSAESVEKWMQQSSKAIMIDIERTVGAEQQRHLSEDKENIRPYDAATVKKKTSSMSSLQVCQTDLSYAIQQIIDCEVEYVTDMQRGIQHYSRPLRHRILTQYQHQTIFQNVEKLVALSEFNLRQLTEIASGKNKSEVGKIYRSKVDFLCEAYESYFHGYRKASLTLSQLKTCKELEHFLQDAVQNADQLCVAAFIQQPTFHLQDLLSNMQMLLSWTPADHPDYADLTHVVQALQKLCDIIHQLSSTSTQRKGSYTSLRSTSSVDIYSSTTTSQASSSSSSRLSSSSIDSEVLDLQQRLLWAKNVKPITLASHSRHVIYAGELFYVEDKIFKVWAILMSDILLLTKADENGQFTVICDPIYIQEISHKNFCQQKGSEFSLTVGMDKHSTCAVTLRAPSINQKMVWKSILEHRLASIQFTHESDLFLCRNSDHIEDFGVL